jgi:hypothetical protein
LPEPLLIYVPRYGSFQLTLLDTTCRDHLSSDLIRKADKITSAEMIALFKQLHASHPQATAIRVVLDNARHNHSAEIKAYVSGDDCRIRLSALPAYAPNLNLIERLWWLFGKQCRQPS